MEEVHDNAAAFIKKQKQIVKGILRRNIKHFLKKRIHEKLEISEMK